MQASYEEYMEHWRSETVELVCSCTASVWDSVDCPIHGAEAEAECARQQKAELDAEYAWLRHAENSMEYCPDWAM